jgi:galactose oxidase
VLTWQDDDGTVGDTSGDLTKAYVVRMSPGQIPSVWDPVPNNQANLFCAGQTFLPDGRLFAIGGQVGAYHYGSDIATIFRHEGGYAWLTPANSKMRDPRWYPGLMTLGSGDLLALGGTKAGEGDGNKVPEVWQTAGGGWRALTSAGREVWSYPWPFLHPANGRVFLAGPARTGYLNTAGTGAWASAPARVRTLRSSGSAAAFGPGQVLAVGGGDGATYKTAERIDLTAATPAWRATGSMRYGRRFHTATTLADGTVLVTGGGENQTDGSNAVLPAELWNPATGAWSLMASMEVPRLYHSVGLLLPSAEILAAGGGRRGGAIDRLSGQIFRPTYLFRGARPTISSAPSRVGYGQSFTVQTPDAQTIATVSLVRLPAVTHGINMSQSFNRLAFTKAATSLSAVAPQNRNHAPPGPYMLFVLNGNGVPSVAKIMLVN